MKRLAIVTAAALLGAAAIPAAATAATVVNITGYTFNPGARTGKVIHSVLPGEPTGNIYIGRLSMTGVNNATMTPVQFLTYCVNIFQNLHTGQFTMAPLSTIATTAAKRQNLNKLLTNTTPSSINASAAIQLAVWEILYETSGTFSVDNGVFKAVNGDSATARGLANGYLNSLGGWQQTSGKSVKLLYAANNQSQIYLGVPEPDTWALMLLGFGAIGIAARRRRARHPAAVTA